MAEPISISIIATLILTTAGEVAVDKAKEELGKVAGDWIKDKLGLQKANKDVDDLRKSLEATIKQSIDTAVNTLIQAFVGIEVTKIQSTVTDWTKNWKIALEQAEIQQHDKRDDVLKAFRAGPERASLLLTRLNDHLMGTDGGDSYIRLFETGIYKRLETEPLFRIQHYYDAARLLLAKTTALQLAPHYFQCCGAYSLDNKSAMASDVAENVKNQWRLMRECMPTMISGLKLNTEIEGPERHYTDSGMQPKLANKDHWWRFVKPDTDKTCLSVEEEVSIAGLMPNHVWELHWDENVAHPTREFRFSLPILQTDQKPNPYTFDELHPGLKMYKDEHREFFWQRKREFPQIWNRFQNRPLQSNRRYGFICPPKDDFKEGAQLRYKIIPQRGDDPMFKLIAFEEEMDVSSVEVKAWAMNRPLLVLDQFVLEDKGTVQG